LDGFTGAWLLHYLFKGEVEICPSKHRGRLPDATGRDVYLIGFAYTREQTKELLRTAKSVTMFGAHRSAQIDLSGLNVNWVGQHITDESPAMIAWQAMCPNAVKAPVIMRYISDAHLQLWKMPHSREVRCALNLEERTFENWTDLMTVPDTEDGLYPFFEDGGVLLADREKTIGICIRSTCRSISIGGHMVPVANCTSNISSEVAIRLAEGAKFGAAYYDSPKGRHFELRSSRNGGIDVSKVAEQYKGAGQNAHAAGFIVPRSHPLSRQ